MPLFPSRWRSRLSNASSGQPRAPALALITGSPRSGTTAVLEWLGARPGVAAREESRILLAAHRFLAEVDRFQVLDDARDDALHALRAACLAYAMRDAPDSTRLLIEKEPLEPIALPAGDYAEFLSHVRSLYPGIRMIFMVRHPVAAVSSMRARQWGNSLTRVPAKSFSLDECITTWRANAALAAQLAGHRLVLRCHYEELVADPSAASVRIADFLGLSGTPPFRPLPPRPSVLTPEEELLVLERTAAERHLLAGLPRGAAAGS
jgi:hypothetical protein